MEQGTVSEFIVRGTGHEQDFTLQVSNTATVADVMAKVKQQRQLHPTKYVRVVCAGKELYASDPVTKATSQVLHVIVTDSAPTQQAATPNVDPPRYAVPEQPPPDWLDLIDPGTVLVYIFGVILTILWILLLINSRMFDRTSVIILLMMTVAFLLPIALSYLPFPTFLTPHAGMRRPGGQQHQGQLQPQPGGHYSSMDGTYIPPRPGAPHARNRHLNGSSNS